MRNKLISLILALLLLFSMPLPALAVETEGKQYVTILNIKSLEKLAENCRLDSYSRNLVVSLQTDLDLEGRDFTGIPIFCGRFEGNGHTIRGLNITMDGSAQGFFRYLTETAVVKNLHLEGNIQMEGSASEIGGFVGNNKGEIRNCSFSGMVSGKEFVGGIAGHNGVSGLIENCTTSGSLSGIHFIGGIAGKNAGVIRSCVNEARINDTPQENEVELTDITLNSALQSESVNTTTDLGGIAGNSTGMIRNCKNLAVIGYTNMGYNVGGIAGTQSGTILNSENYGSIYGRKEVGGIAGQMEPATVMNFEADVFQILSRQLDGMGRIVNEASSNVQDSGEAIIGRVGQMHHHVNTAKDALVLLIPDVETGEMPDEDTLQAARNGLSSSFNGMSQTLDGISATAYSALGEVTSNLYAMNNQINAMRQTIGNVSETLGGSIVDKSDEDTDGDLTGKVADCCNYGEVHADLNGGGITGAMAMENDADVEEDMLVNGENSLNFESEIRAVVLDCENDAVVTVAKQNAGGIVGLQSMGLVKSSRNYGKIDAGKADYVGGISGRGAGFIRKSHANAEIFGKTYVGGIAGAAPIATGCYSLVRIHDSVEKVGGILGFREENTTEDENPLAGNYYLPLEGDLGAVDRISYDGMAQPVEEDVFFLLDGVPERFSQVIITFLYGNDTARKFTMEFGSSFQEEWIPPIPPKDGREAYWDGLDKILETGVFFDVVVQQKYTSQRTVLESMITRAEIPLLFVQGTFSEDAELTVQQMKTVTGLPEGGALLEAWAFVVSEPDRQNQLRLQLPELEDAENIQLAVLGADGNWRTAEYSRSGRYAVIALNPYDSAVALLQQNAFPWMAVITVLGIGAIALGLFYIRKKKKVQ